MTIKKRTSKLYSAFGKFSQKYVMPTVNVIIGIAIMYWLSSLVFAFALEKTSSKGWAWTISVVFVVVLSAIGAANDSAKAKKERKETGKKSVTRRQTPPPSSNPLDPGSGYPPSAPPVV